MCSQRTILTRTPETAKEMQKNVNAYRNPIAANQLRPEDLTGTLTKKSSGFSIHRHIIAPIPRDREGIRYGGCDF